MITIVQSIRPRWTKDIFSLKKRIELRKDKPATEEPFRVLIYETKGGITKESRHLPFPQHEGAGAIVGEYLCVKTFKFSAEFTEPANALGECHEDISTIGTMKNRTKITVALLPQTETITPMLVGFAKKVACRLPTSRNISA